MQDIFKSGARIMCTEFQTYWILRRWISKWTHKTKFHLCIEKSNFQWRVFKVLYACIKLISYTCEIIPRRNFLSLPKWVLHLHVMKSFVDEFSKSLPAHDLPRVTQKLLYVEAKLSRICNWKFYFIGPKMELPFRSLQKLRLKIISKVWFSLRTAFHTCDSSNFINVFCTWDYQKKPHTSLFSRNNNWKFRFWVGSH